jgi:hypothetical protein
MLFCSHLLATVSPRTQQRVTHVNAPELLNGVEGNNLFEEITPVVSTLHPPVSLSLHRGAHPSHTFPLGGFVNQSVHLFISGCLTLKLSASWNTVSCSNGPSDFCSVVAFSSGSPFGGETGISFSGRCSSLISNGVSAAAVSVAIVVACGIVGRDKAVVGLG